MLLLITFIDGDEEDVADSPAEFDFSEVLRYCVWLSTATVVDRGGWLVGGGGNLESNDNDQNQHQFIMDRCCFLYLCVSNEKMVEWC